MSFFTVVRRSVAFIFGFFRIIRRSVFMLILLASIAFNAALLLSDAVFKMASGAVSAVTGVKSLVVRQADEVSDLSTELVAERAAKREVRSELAETTVELAAERQVTREIRSELAQNTAELATQRAVTRQIRSELAETSAQLTLAARARREMADAASGIRKRVATRSARAATRAAASAPGKAIPTAGAVLVATLTAVEIADLCATVSDMNELAAVFKPDDETEEEALTVCGAEVPTRSEIIEAVQNAPGKAWDAARETIPTVEQLKAMDLPDVDWNELGASIAETSTGWRDAGANWGGSKWDQIKSWWAN